MNINRREFLIKGLVSAGAAAAVGTAGTAAVKAMNATGASALDIGPKLETTGNGGACCASMSAMTPDHQVIHIKDGKVVSRSLPVLDTAAAIRQGIPGRKWIMVFDLAKCDGCKKCTEACSKMHGVPADREWIKVFKMQDSPDTAPYWFPKPCFHCDDPPCTRVCPVDATFKREDGVVLIDNERCIGCRFCMAACPYSTRYFNWGRPHDPPELAIKPYSPEQGYPRRVGTVEKCDFCPDMAAQGKLPGCVTGCAMGVIYYGDANEDAVTNGLGETLQLSRLLQDRAGYRYMEELGTEPRVYYLPPKNRIYPGPKIIGEHRV
jgi:molybdopterin-containing oxidoreductase family iron-sulfur binding subunit